MMKPTYVWGLASHVIKKTTTSSALRSAQPIIITSAFSTTSSPPPLLSSSPSHSVPPPPRLADSTTSTALELNDKLVNLARQAQYDEAYRLRNHLFQNKIQIKHHLVYEKPALASIDLGVGVGVGGGRMNNNDEGLENFTLWFSLVPHRNELPPSIITNQDRRYIYSDTRFSLLRCGNPRKYLRYIMVFGNIMAAKGFIHVSFISVARVVVRFASKEVVVDYFKRLENATYCYWEQQEEPEVGGPVLTWFWEVVVQLYLERGWLELAFEIVVEKNGMFELSDELCMVLLKKLEAKGDVRRVSLLRKTIA